VEKAIATMLLTVAAVVAVMAVVNAIMPALGRSSASIVASADNVDERISSQIEIVHAAGIAGGSTVDAWAKNVGVIAIAPVDRVDVFFGPGDNFVRVPYGDPGCTAPCWSYTIENDVAWNPTSTLRVTISWDQVLATDTTYYVKVVIPNGVSDAKFFTV
jgi:archaeal flagellar protein FlaG